VTFVLLALLALFVVEVTVMIAVANATSVITMFLALTLLCAAGAWVVKRQGFATWRRINDGFARGEMPTDAVLDGLIWMVAGALLLVPGFVSDLAALVLVLPSTRALLRPLVVRRAQVRAESTFNGSAVRFATFGFSTARGGFDDDFLRRRPRHDDGIIDLDAEEIFLDEPRGELGPGT